MSCVFAIELQLALNNVFSFSFFTFMLMICLETIIKKILIVCCKHKEEEED